MAKQRITSVASALLAQIEDQFSAEASGIFKARDAAIAEGEARAKGHLMNADLLRFDAKQFKKTGNEVYSSQYRQGLQRTASAAGSYVGSGVRLEGSALGVIGDIKKEGLAEAKAQRDSYVYQARRAQKQADIQTYYADLEKRAGQYEAASIVSKLGTPQQAFEKARLEWLGQNKAAAQAASRVNPLSLAAGQAADTMREYYGMLTSQYDKSKKSEEGRNIAVALGGYDAGHWTMAGETKAQYQSAF